MSVNEWGSIATCPVFPSYEKEGNISPNLNGILVPLLNFHEAFILCSRWAISHQACLFFYCVKSTETLYFSLLNLFLLQSALCPEGCSISLVTQSKNLGVIFDSSLPHTVCPNQQILLALSSKYQYVQKLITSHISVTGIPVQASIFSFLNYFKNFLPSLSPALPNCVLLFSESSLSDFF